MTLWSTGTVRVQGKGEGGPLLQALVDEFTVPPPDPGGADARAVTAMAGLARDRPWIGIDESGKGDYFGPLVSAAVLVTPAAAAELEALGVRDSKKLTDKRVRALAPEIRRRTRHTRTTVAPPRYNDLYAQFRREGKRLNQLLAWAHVRSLTDLLDGGDELPAYAIVDQFADARVIDRAAKDRVGGLRIVQFPRAEADVAVAAASILAREGFVDWLERAGTRVGVDLPRGASPQVVAAARQLVARGGRDLLGEVAKLHFATTDAVLTG